MNIIQTVVIQGLAQQPPAAPAAAGQQGGEWGMGLLVYALLFVGMYFLLFAPQRKRQKELEKLQTELAVGDKVLAAGGIYGRVVSIKDDRITLELDSGRLVVHKSAIMGKDADAVVQA
jgi:preprotein translocase subunit YajC